MNKFIVNLPDRQVDVMWHLKWHTQRFGPIKTKEAFYHVLSGQFWSRSEYEMRVEPLFREEDDSWHKVDIFMWNIESNLDLLWELSKQEGFVVPDDGEDKKEFKETWNDYFYDRADVAE